MRSRWLAAGVLFLPVLRVGAQEPAVSTKVEVVRVDVSVTDRKGHPVRDLTAADFEIREGATPRPITNFAFVTVGLGGGRCGSPVGEERGSCR
jgi:hypothetical protein